MLHLACVVINFLAVEACAATSQQLYLECLADFQRHAETIWSAAFHPNAPEDAGYWGDGRSSGNGGIRGSCGVALSYAVLARAAPTSTNRPARLVKIRQALNYAANTHLSGASQCVDSLRWGHGWQSSLWAGSMGLACLLVQDDLPAATVQAVQRALADEATYRAGIAPASGYIGDTKAEENGWNGNVVALAAAWLRTHPEAGLWLESAKSYLANTYTVSNKGDDPLASWINTVTLYPDYSLENHGFYHPTYQMVAGMSMGDSLLMAQLANPALAAELRPFAEHNVLAVWTNLQHLVLDSGEFAYPSGLDWELHDYEQNSYIAWLAAHFNDSLARWADEQLSQLTRYRQLVNGDGRFVGSSGGGFFREAVEARRTAIAWLHWVGADHSNGEATSPAPVFEHLDTVKLIAHRGLFGFVSLSYGAKIMALIEPPAISVPTNVYVTTPRVPGIIGLGALGNPTGARLISLQTNSSGFTAQLEITNGVNGLTQVYVNCTGETVAIVEVPWPVAGFNGLASGSFTLGIENDPLTGGSCVLEWSGGAATITNRSGTLLNISNNWLCVAGNYGIAAGPEGYFRYQAASSYNRAGAAQDTLQFFADDPIGPRYAVWFPGENPSQTASNANLISWSTSGTNAVLTFPGLGGAPAQINALIALPKPRYTPYTLAVSEVEAFSSQTSYPPGNAVDGNFSSFWVSLLGPTNHAEWLKMTFPRTVALSGFQVYPRIDNGGYGPRDIQIFVDVAGPIPASGIPADGRLVSQNTMEPVSTLNVQISQPVSATNAVLVITSGYDRGNTNNPRNVQVVEVVFFERALPGTFAAWSLSQFPETQLSDPLFSGPLADPDSDGVLNLAEFALMGNPLLPDAAIHSLLSGPPDNGTFSFSFRQRSELGDVERFFETSTNLVNWFRIPPMQLITNPPGSFFLQATFPVQNAASFYRIGFVLTGTNAGALEFKRLP